MGVSADRLWISDDDARDVLLDEIATQLDAFRADVAAFVEAPSEAPLREALIAKLRDWAGRAAAAQQALLSEELRSCQLILRAGAVLGDLDAQDEAALADALGRVEAYIQAERGREMTPTSGPVPAVALRPRRSLFGVLRAMVVGGHNLAEGLVAEDWATEDENAPAFEVDRVPDVTQARPVIAENNPEVVIIDAALDGARKLVERLLNDRSTDAIPLVVLGDWTDPEQASPYIALGVARCLTKPVTPGLLRRACLEVVPAWQGSSLEPLGATTVEGLGMRLADEIHRGLCDAAGSEGRHTSVDLGDGAEVLATVWSAVARIRELVTAKSQGKIRFALGGPVPTLPRAAWLSHGHRRGAAARVPALHEVRRVGDDTSLEGYRILVADDDLSTNWFLTGVLKEAGASVLEAFDGEQALDQAYRTLPDVILADIVMPHLDGFALCRAFKRDVVLRSVPVLLTSWKEDLLQRMRELGAQADGYLRKEASGNEVLQRLAEILRSQRALARRIEIEPTVRGRLDGFTPYALLKLVCRLRPDCRVTVRDSHNSYEIEIRGGRPVSATITAASGSTHRGAQVIARLLGVGAGRFAIEPVDEQVAAVEIEGTLDDQLRQPIALARAAQGLLSGQSLMRVDRVRLDESALAMSLVSTPEPSRGLLRALLAGTSPRTLIGTGRANAELVERVLCDAARYGAIEEVVALNGAELLTDAFERELAIVEGLSTRAALRKRATTPVAMAPDVEPELEDDDDDVVDELSASDPEPVEALFISRHSEPEPIAARPLPQAEPSPPPQRVSWVPDTPAFGSAERRGNTPVLASVEVAAAQRRNTPILAVPVDREPLLAQLDDEPPKPRKPATSEPATEVTAREPVVEAPRAEAVPPPPPLAVEEPRAPFTSRAPLPSAYVPHPVPPAAAKGSSRWLVPLVFGTIGVALAIGARWWREHAPVTAALPPPAMQQPLAAPPAAAVGPQVAPEQEPTVGDDEQTGDEQGPLADDMIAEKVVEIPLSEKEREKLKEGEGMLEIVAGRKDTIFIDGKKIGRGPTVRTTVVGNDQPHEVRVKMRGEERVRYVKAKPGMRVRLRVAPPWSR